MRSTIFQLSAFLLAAVPFTVALPATVSQTNDEGSTVTTVQRSTTINGNTTIHPSTSRTTRNYDEADYYDDNQSNSFGTTTGQFNQPTNTRTTTQTTTSRYCRTNISSYLVEFLRGDRNNLNLSAEVKKNVRTFTQCIESVSTQKNVQERDALGNILSAVSVSMTKKTLTTDVKEQAITALVNGRSKWRNNTLALYDSLQNFCGTSGNQQGVSYGKGAVANDEGYGNNYDSDDEGGYTDDEGEESDDEGDEEEEEEDEEEE